ncbi:MAG TPA: DNA polymerase III subunit delta [Gaiellaceae bacterium]|nr:DNA polymerase III subunit delta [Gaiellaceae bacterium]
MAADDLKPVYLIAGSDRPKVDRAVDRLRGRFEADATELLSAGETTGDDAVAACNALGLFGSGTRLVLIDGVEAWKAPDAKAVGEYLKAPAPGTTLALVGAELKKDAPIAKAVAGSGDVLIWDVPTRGLPGWVAEQFKLRGVQADGDACRLLIELVGDDLYELASEVDKLATWAEGDRRISDADVEQLVAPRAESPGFVLTDAWGARDVAGVLRAAEHMIERSGDPKSRTIPRIAGSLTNHVSRIRKIQKLEAQGVPSKEAASQLKMHPFYVQKLYAQARNYSGDELNSVTVRLAALDHALKGGSRLSNDLELERALVEVTQPVSS